MLDLNVRAQLASNSTAPPPNPLIVILDQSKKIFSYPTVKQVAKAY